MSIGPIKPSETGATPPPIKPEKKHPITKMFQKVCTFVRSPIQTLRGRTITTQSAPIVSQKKLGEIKATLERKYGITPSNKNITSLEELVNDIKDQTPTKSFLDRELREDEAGHIIMAAHLLREGESASVGDALKRAKGRFLQHESTWAKGFFDFLGPSGVAWAGLFMLVTAPIAVPLAFVIGPIALPIAAGIVLAPLTIGLSAQAIWRHITIKKYEGTDPQVQKIKDIAKKTILTPKLQPLVERALYYRPLGLPIPSELGKQDITKWKEWCEDFLTAVEEEQEKISQTPLVISTPPLSKTPFRCQPVKNVSDLSSNASNTIKTLTNLKNFLDPLKDTDEQKLQLDWYTPDWTMIREKLRKEGPTAVMPALLAERERLHGGEVNYVEEISKQHQTYLDTISKALLQLNDDRLKEFLENTSAENSFNVLIDVVNKDLPDPIAPFNEKIKIPDIVNQPVPKNLVFDWSYTRHL